MISIGMRVVLVGLIGVILKLIIMVMTFIREGKRAGVITQEEGLRWYASPGLAEEKQGCN